MQKGGLLKILVLGVTLTGTMSVRANSAVEAMTDAATQWLASLPEPLQQKALIPFASDQRMDWHYVPRSRPGVSLGEMSETQRQRAHALLLAGLSQRGYQKTTNIISLEAVLHELEGSRRVHPRESGRYYFTIFGRPGLESTWGWRVEGHHLSLNWVLSEGKVIAETPSFFGANPAEVPSGPRKGLRVLAEEEDLARAFMQSLTSEQRRKAVFSASAPSEIITGARRRVEPLPRAGISAADLTPEQKKELQTLIRNYLDRHRPELADADWRKVEQAGFDQVWFAWAGSLERKQGHYYRVQGPTFLLEYDNTQNDANHIHTVWRDFQGDFGEDLLREHYTAHPHPHSH